MYVVCPVPSIRFTHNNISAQFRDGRPITDLVKDLRSRTVEDTGLQNKKLSLSVMRRCHLKLIPGYLITSTSLSIGRAPPPKISKAASGHKLWLLASCEISTQQQSPSQSNLIDIE